MRFAGTSELALASYLSSRIRRNQADRRLASRLLCQRLCGTEDFARMKCRICAVVLSSAHVQLNRFGLAQGRHVSKAMHFLTQLVLYTTAKNDNTLRSDQLKRTLGSLSGSRRTTQIDHSIRRGPYDCKPYSPVWCVNQAKTTLIAKQRNCSKSSSDRDSYTALRSALIAQQGIVHSRAES